MNSKPGENPIPSMEYEERIQVLEQELAYARLRIEQLEFPSEDWQAEQAIRRYELIANHSRDIILFMRHNDGHILEANLAAVQAYGYSHAELLELTIHDLRHPDTQGLTREQMALASSQGVLFETIHQRKDGSSFPVEVSSRGVTIHGERSLISIIRDISQRKQAEIELEQNRSWVQGIFNSMTEGVVVFDLQGIVLDVNPAGLQLTGYKDLEEIHQHYSVFERSFDVYSLDGQPVPSERWPIGRVLAGEKFTNYELSVHRKGQSELWIGSFSGSLVRDSIGIPLVGVFTMRDITEAKQVEAALRESEEQYRAFFDLAAIGTAQAEPSTGQLLKVNDRYCEITGYSREELLSDTVRNLTHPEDREKDWEAYNLMVRGETTEYNEEKRYIRKDGQVIWVHVTARPIHDASGNAIRTAGVIMDITERKKAEAAMEEYARKLEESNQELQDFAYVASHDLQEPLRKIRAFGDMLGQNASGKLDELELDQLRRMKDAADRMQSMIQGLLDLSRIRTRGKPFSQVDLQAIVDDVVSDLELRIQRSGGRVICKNLPTIQADPLQMRQLMQNLIGNGLKYHRLDVPPVVKVSGEITNIARSKARFVQIVVEDNGIGFDMQYAGRIFQPFQRLHERSQYEGTGMGLAICKKIVERHGGRITVDSIPGRGSSFTVRIPWK